jgi:hypothetical protein
MVKDMFDLHSETIPMSFWESLGQYVYGYIDSNVPEKYTYIGKGHGNRAITHIKSKQYKLENLIIIARNLENFGEDKTDLQSFIIESFLITLHTPTDNSIFGHHKECFVMAKFSELFNEFVKDQHDNFESLPSWYTENYEKFAGRLNVLTIKSHLHSFEFQTRQQMQISFDVTTEGTVSLRVAIWTNKEEQQNMRLNQLKKFCSALGISKDKITKTGAREIYAIEVDDIDHALQFIDDFFS